MKRYIKLLAEAIMPVHLQLPLRYSYRRLKGTLDEEMLYVNSLLMNRRRFLDVGSNVGIYSYHFLRRMKKVEAFEPIKEITYRLEAHANRSLSIHNCALSNEVATLPFHIPVDDRGNLIPSWASLEPLEQKCVTRNVPVKRLDDFAFADVDLFKIDVEGHEMNVINGALETIKKCKPIMLIEIEQRHISVPIWSIFQQIADLGYTGCFLSAGNPIDIEYFEYEKHQKPFLDDVMNKGYINNFIFTSR